MSISALALFGSRARGDHEPNSDTDLLLVTSVPAPRHITMGNLSMSLYSFENLVGRARCGDLFICHIVKEARPLYDPDDNFEALNTAFRLRKSYAQEISQASDLGWFLVRFGSNLGDASVVTRRVAWCVRTILIARSAECGHPVFSTEGLTAFAELPMVQRLIRQKGQNILDPTAFDTLRQILGTRGKADPVPSATSEDAYASRFEETANNVALQTLRLAQHEATETY